jgi:hypothetical protein
MIRRISFLAALVLCSSMVSAQALDFSLSGGYSHMFPQKSGSLFFDRDGEYLDANFAFQIPDVVVPLYAGLGVGASGYWESHDGPFVFNNNNSFGYTSSLYSDTEMIEVQPRLALKLVIPGLRGFYIRPQIGAGLLIDNYSVDQANVVNDIAFFHTLQHTGAAFDIRPDVEAGWSLGRTSIGVDLSYMAGWGGFGQMGNTMQEFRAGVFARFRY